MLKNSLFNTLFLFQPFSFFSASTPLFSSFFCFCFPRCCSAPTLFFFSFCVLPFIFQPKILLFQPKHFSAFQPKNTFFPPKTFLLQPKTFFSSAQNVFFFFFPVQPLFSSSFFCFILFWFSPLFSLSAPPFFLFFSSVYPRPNVLFSCFTSLLFE